MEILETLVRVKGWEYLSGKVDVRCFSRDPSMEASLKFLQARRNQWVRDPRSQPTLQPLPT